MRILIVSFYFPPANTMGSIAVAETAKYLRLAGDEVEILTAADSSLDSNLDMTGIAETPVHRTAWRDVNRPLDRLRRGDDGRPQPGHAVEATGMKRVAATTYQNLVHLPDSKIGWFGRAVHVGRRIVDRFEPHVILASGPPATGYLIASALTKHARASRPTLFCAHFRDPWSGNALSSATALRRRLDRSWQRRTLRRADIIVANDLGHSRELAAELGRAVTHWPNAFDEDDYTGDRHPNADGPIELIHTGSIYPRVQDIGPLFKALAEPRPGMRPIHVTFYGAGLDHVNVEAARYGVSDMVDVMAPISKAAAARQQMDAAVLLLFAPSEDNWLLGKVFAYAGARRPVWAIGPASNATSQLVKTEGLGRVLSDAAHVSEALDDLVAAGPSADLAITDVNHLSRRQRVAELRILIGAAQPPLSGRTSRPEAGRPTALVPS